ncbi:MAG TPA: peptidase C39 family protein [Candidatus Stackebrandtia faecavium]|nr:peptidase C39 family protein [Candidatus Stackebrandtia faecavium]
MTKPVSRRTVLAATGVAATATAGVASARVAFANEPATPWQEAAEEQSVSFDTWQTSKAWSSGTADGVGVVSDGRNGIVVDQAIDTISYTDPYTDKTSEWEIATWTSAEVSLEFGAAEIIPSWNVDTPAGSWLQVDVQATYDDGEKTPWYCLGRWASGEGDITRTSVGDQGDGRSSVTTDAIAVKDPAAVRLQAYQIKLTLHRKPGSKITPTVWRASALASFVPQRFEVPESSPGEVGVELDVPRYSQMIHKGQYPEYGGGGAAWCSPTSSQMIIESFGRKAREEDLEWVDPDYADPQICHAARSCFDKQFEGCGNWPFNTAYAATYKDMDAVVTRIATLTEAEALVNAGFPVITSVAFMESELDGSGYSTEGHLMTIIGFDENGDVIANDPASPDNDAVRHIYKRHQFETIWLRSMRKNADGDEVGCSGGVCYLYKPTDMEWPDIPALRH